MRVLHVTPGYVPARSFGGPIESTHQLCRALLDQGVDVRVLTTNVTGASDPLIEASRDWTSIDGVPVRYYAQVSRGKLSPALWAAILAELPRVDLVHLTGVWHAAAPVTLWPCHRRSLPCVVSPRGTLESWSLAHKRWKKAPALALLKPFLKMASAIHATSDKEASSVRALLPDAALWVVPNGVDLRPATAVQRGGRSWQRALALSPAARLLVVLGRLHEVKGIDIAIEALSAVHPHLPDVHLVVAGPDPDGEWERLSRLAQAQGVGSHVHHVGQVDGELKFQLLADAELLLLPSRQENFGNVVVEALAVGTPAVTSEHTPWQLLETAGCGAWLPLSAEAFASRVRTMLADDSGRQRMGERGQALVRERYTWPVAAQALARHYQTLLTSKPLA